MYFIHTRDLYFNSAAVIVYAERVWLVRTAALMHAIADTTNDQHDRRTFNDRRRRRSHLIPLIISRCGQRQRFGWAGYAIQTKNRIRISMRPSYSYVYLCATGSASILTLNGPIHVRLHVNDGCWRAQNSHISCRLLRTWCIWCFFPITHERWPLAAGRRWPFTHYATSTCLFIYAVFGASSSLIASQ